MQKNILTGCLILVLATCCGCMDTSRYRYIPSEPLRAETTPLPLTLAVSYLDDARGTRHYEHAALIWLPLVPYADSRYNKPELSPKFSFKGLKPREDFARAILEEIKQNNLFSNLVLVPDNKAQQADLIITGKIVEASVSTKLTLYGASFLGVVPWLAGLPQGVVNNNLDVKYEMRRASDNAVVWEWEIIGERDRVFGLYYNYSKDEPYFGINDILRKGLHDGVARLADEVRRRPVAYWRPDAQ